MGASGWQWVVLEAKGIDWTSAMFSVVCWLLMSDWFEETINNGDGIHFGILEGVRLFVGINGTTINQRLASLVHSAYHRVSFQDVALECSLYMALIPPNSVCRTVSKTLLKTWALFLCKSRFSIKGP